MGPRQSAARSIVAPFEAVAYVYIGLGVAASEEERDLRPRHAAEKLRGPGASETAAAAIAARIVAAPPAYGTLAVFISQDGSVLHEQVLADADLADDAGCRCPAPVTPLLAWGQDRPPHLLVVTDRAGGDITADPGAGQAQQTWTVVGPDDEIARKRGPGGWSQPSYQRRVEDSLRHNAARVAEEVATRRGRRRRTGVGVVRRLRAVRLLSERLPNGPALLVRHISGSRAADGSQAGRDSRVEQVLREAAAAQTARLLAALHEHLAPGGLAVEGVEDTIDALARGRVVTLLVQDTPADSRTAWFAAGPTDVYPDREAGVLSDAPVRSGRLIDVAVRSALLSDAHVRVIRRAPPANRPAGSAPCADTARRDRAARSQSRRGGVGMSVDNAGDIGAISALSWRAEVRETHSAVVLLLGERAYKIKKPVDLGLSGFPDAGEPPPGVRRELELNRRLAPDVYLDVVTVRGADRRAYEHGVVMRRMPEDLRLSTMIRCGAAVDDHLRALARLMATFHAAANRGPRIAAEGSAVGLRRRWTDNLRETAVYRGGPLAEPLYDEISRLALGFIEGRGPLLAERAASGLSVDGHGDLIAEDVFCLADYPRVLDCIEFDDRLRWLDVLDDVAFLAMDIEHLLRPDLAQRFVEWYLEFSGGPAVASLQHHYVAYRAFVRAKVCCIQAAQGLASAAAEADSYARLALRHLEAGEVTLLLVGGAPGTGKTTLGQGVADRRGWVLLSSDEVRRQVPEVAGGRYNDTAKAATYHELRARARQALEHGESVVADATWGDAAMRELAERLATATASRLVALECRAPVETAAAPQRRLSGGGASEAGADIARQLAARRDPWLGAIVVETDESAEQSLADALTAIAGRR